jgi:hypothetical protein
MTRAPRPAWTNAEKALVGELFRQGRTSAEIADLLRDQGITRSQKAILHQRNLNGWHAEVARSPVLRQAGPLTATGDMLVLSDPHCPYHDSDWVNRCISLAVKWGVRLAGIAGDLIDWSAFSVYGRVAEVEAEDEIRSAEQFTRTLATVFEGVYYAPGNHEVRLARMTGYALSLDRLSDWWLTRPNVYTTRRHWFWLESGGEKYRITHPGNYSRIPANNSAKLCAKYGAHVIAGHSHHWGMAQDVTGRRLAVDTGMCADVQRLDYVQDVDTNNPAMAQGAVIVKAGACYLLSPLNIAGYETL